MRSRVKKEEPSVRMLVKETNGRRLATGHEADKNEDEGVGNGEETRSKETGRSLQRSITWRDG